MRRQSFIPIAVTFLVTVIGGANFGPAAQASSTAPSPTRFVTASFPIGPGDRITYELGNVDLTRLEPPFVSFVAFDRVGPSGKEGPASLVAEYFDDKVALTASVEGDDFTVARVTDPRGCCYGSIHAVDLAGSVESGSIGRFAFAVWGADESIRLYINGAERALRPAEETDATYVSPASFVDGIAADAGESNASAERTFSRRAHGHNFTVFLPGDIGAGRATAPSGSQSISLSAGPFTGSYFAGDTDGTWNYELFGEATATAGEQPVVWAMDVP